jgi:hypothetical protein
MTARRFIVSIKGSRAPMMTLVKLLVHTVLSALETPSQSRRRAGGAFRNARCDANRPLEVALLNESRVLIVGGSLLVQARQRIESAA